jgi:hypothetical protein
MMHGLEKPLQTFEAFFAFDQKQTILWKDKPEERLWQRKTGRNVALRQNLVSYVVNSKACGPRLDL